MFTSYTRPQYPQLIIEQAFIWIRLLFGGGFYLEETFIWRRVIFGGGFYSRKYYGMLLLRGMILTWASLSCISECSQDRPTSGDDEVIHSMLNFSPLSSSVTAYIR